MATVVKPVDSDHVEEVSRRVSPGSVRDVRIRRDVLIVSGLYLLASVLLLYRIDSHPAHAYNWEPYTVWRYLEFREDPSLALLRFDDGLMTDSGRSPLIVLPVRMASAVGLDGLAAMRVPVALVSAAAVPLLWIVGRRLVGDPAGLLAATLLALSPAYLLYGRTATTVGISLVPALLTVYILIRMLTGSWSWRSLVALQALLVVSGYAYAPIRFLWPLSILLFAIGIWYRREHWRRYAAAGLVTAAVLPIVITAVNHPTDPDIPSAVVEYYHARGEQILDLSQTPGRYSRYLGNDATAGATPLMLASKLVFRNTGDFVDLLLDRATQPAITHSWSVHGRLYPLLLVPFFLIGLARTLQAARTSVEHTILLTLFLGFGAPMLLTSRVHVGRLIFLLPILLLLVASGFIWTTGHVLDRLHNGLSMHPAVATAIACSILVLAVSWLTYSDFYHVTASATPESKTEYLVRSMLPGMAGHGGIVLITGEKGELKDAELLVSVLRISLGDELQFVDVGDPSSLARATGERPLLYHGISAEQLSGPANIPGGCSNIYLVEHGIEDSFHALTRNWRDACGPPPAFVVLQR